MLAGAPENGKFRLDSSKSAGRSEGCPQSARPAGPTAARARVAPAGRAPRRRRRRRSAPTPAPLGAAIRPVVDLRPQPRRRSRRGRKAARTACRAPRARERRACGLLAHAIIGRLSSNDGAQRANESHFMVSPAVSSIRQTSRRWPPVARDGVMSAADSGARSGEGRWL
jgi:hypothetical protein